MTPQPRPAFKAVLIPAGEPPRIVDLPRGTARFLQSLQALCDTSCVQPIQITSRWQAWLADNGIAEGKPVNQAATVLARTYGWQVTLYGTAGHHRDAQLRQHGRPVTRSGRGHPRRNHHCASDLTPATMPVTRPHAHPGRVHWHSSSRPRHPCRASR